MSKADTRMESRFDQDFLSLELKRNHERSANELFKIDTGFTHYEGLILAGSDRVTFSRILQGSENISLQDRTHKIREVFIQDPDRILGSDFEKTDPGKIVSKSL